MKSKISWLFVANAFASVVYEKERSTFTKSPFEKYDKSVTNIAYDTKAFSTRLT
jgi:hypothetical protein